MKPPPDSSSATSSRPRVRRGRPLAGTEQERRELVLDAALDALVDVGAEHLTMALVARRASASKETLYRWFGDRHGLLVELIQRNADRSAHQVEQRLAADGVAPTAAEASDTLTGYGIGLLSLLTGPSSVALNRAAMVDPDLRVLLLEQGRHRIGPLVERYLDRLATAGIINADSVGGAPGAFELYYGLVVRDTQIRVLLGEPAPAPDLIAARARGAVAQFFTLCAA